MTITVRSPTAWKDVPIGWDKNRIDVALAEESIKNLAPSVCAIVSSIGTSGTLEEAKRKPLPVMRYKDVENILQGKADTVSRYLSRLAGKESGETEHSIWVNKHAQAEIRRLERSIAKLKEGEQNAATVELIKEQEQALEKEKKEIQEREDRMKASQLIYEKFAARLPDLPWIDLENKTPQFDLRFDRQRSLANGTGFTFAKGYVMTAGHAIPSVGFTSERIFFNLRQEWNGGKVRDPEQDECHGKVRADSSWAIKRFVLGEYHTLAPTKNVPAHLKLDPNAKTQPLPSVDYLWFHDAAILELQQPVSQRWEAKPLKITTSSAVAGEEVHLLGYPTGLPLKYISYSKKDNVGNSKPKVHRTPGLNAADRVLATFSADIDTFKGNSGGPLFRTSNNEVIGIVRGGAAVVDDTLPGSSRPRPSTIHPLTTALIKWNTDLCAELGINKPASAFEDPSFIWDYEEMEFHPNVGPNGTFALRQIKPNEAPNVPINTLFNRVDYYAGFTSSLRNFLNTPKHAFQLQLVLTLKTGSEFPSTLTPVIKAGGVDHFCTFTGTLESGRELAEEMVSTYRWQINLNSADDLMDRWSSVSSFTSFLPTTMLEEESGLCALEEVHIELPYTPSTHERRIESITGHFEAVYVVEQGVPAQNPAPVNNALLFEIDFDMQPTDGNRTRKYWQGFLGQHIPPTSKEGIPVGGIWRGPRVVSVPFIKKNAWNLQQAANDAARYAAWPGYPSLVGF